MKIVWVGEEQGVRYECLKKESSGIETLSFEDIKKSDADLVLFHPQVYTEALAHIPFATETINVLGFFDGFFRQHNRLVPWCSYPSTFQSLLIQRGAFLDPGKMVLVVGDAVAGRSVIYELFRMGFRSFQILREQSASPHWLESQTTALFGVETKVVLPKDLVHFSGESAVLFYGFNDPTQAPFEHEISYLNFLSRPGLVVDFNPNGFLQAVLKDTEEAELSLLCVEEVESSSIKAWLAKV